MGSLSSSITIEDLSIGVIATSTRRALRRQGREDLVWGEENEAIPVVLRGRWPAHALLNAQVRHPSDHRGQERMKPIARPVPSPNGREEGEGNARTLTPASS